MSQHETFRETLLMMRQKKRRLIKKVKLDEIKFRNLGPNLMLQTVERLQSVSDPRVSMMIIIFLCVNIACRFRFQSRQFIDDDDRVWIVTK